MDLHGINPENIEIDVDKKPTPPVIQSAVSATGVGLSGITPYHIRVSFLLLVLFVLLGSFGVMIMKKGLPSFNIGQSGPATLAKFNRTQHGMTYEEVVQIVGAQGTLQGSNRIEGIPGLMDSIVSESYIWRGRGNSNAAMSIIFQNNRVFQKVQIGLR